MRFKLRQSIQSSKGVSLVGMLVSIALLSMVFLGAAYIMSQTKSVETQTGLRSSMDRSQILTLQKIRSAKFLRKNLNLDPALPSPNTALVNCLKNIGTNCRTAANIPQDFVELPGSREETTCGSTGCKIETFAQYKTLCSSDTSCQSVAVKVQTLLVTANPSSQNIAKPRETNFSFPAMLLIGARDMNFGCAQARSMIGIDFATRAALCSSTAPANCGSDRPMTGMGASGCPDLESVNCPNGTQSLGLFRSQSGCL